MKKLSKNIKDKNRKEKIIKIISKKDLPKNELERYIKKYEK